MFKAILFDMDGVLFDSEMALNKKREDFFKKYNLSISKEECISYAGGHSKEYLPEIFKRYGYSDEECKNIVKEYYTFRLKDAEFYRKYVFDDMVDTLQYCKNKGYYMGLVSSTEHLGIQTALHVMNVEHIFDLIVSGQDVPKTKPDPAIYLKAIEECPYDVDSIVVIEDSTMGIQSARKAGLKVICKKDNRFGYNQSGCWNSIDTLSDLKKLI